MPRNEADTCRVLVTPALRRSGWSDDHLVEQYIFTDGRIVKPSVRKDRKRADYLLRYSPDWPIAVVEAKAEDRPYNEGIQQAKNYAAVLGVPFAYATNGHGIREFDFLTGDEVDVSEYPSPEELWQRYRTARGLHDPDTAARLLTPCNLSAEKPPRYYQSIAINRVVEALVTGKRRALVVMATGTGKTSTAFQICWKLWESRWSRDGANRRPKILFLADLDVLVDDPIKRDFAPFKEAITRVQGRAGTAHDIYFALYQAIAQSDRTPLLYREWSPDYFDLIIVDECHRGSAGENSLWKDILRYFSSAAQLGLTATPAHAADRDTLAWFGQPLYTYSLRQGIEDGYLAPYRVYHVVTDVDATGWRPYKGQLDDHGRPIPDELYGTPEFERKLVLPERNKIIAQHLTEHLRRTDRFAKTIIFCVDQDHAQAMRGALAACNADLVKENPNYVVRITADEGATGKDLLWEFMAPKVKRDSPILATTSKMLTTGVDAQTCQNIVILRVVRSMTEFKQIIGRGTRVRTDFGKWVFNVLDYTGTATVKFADPAFDGDPLPPNPGDPLPGDPVVSLPHGGDGGDGNEGNGDSEPLLPPDDWPRPLPPTHPVPPPAPSPFPSAKHTVSGVIVRVIAELVQVLDPNGHVLRVESFADYTRSRLCALYPTSEQLREAWKTIDGRSVVVKSLENAGIDLADLARATKRGDADPFDQLCNLAYGAPILTRRQRVEAAKRRKPDFFTQYGEAARTILADLVEMYAKDGPDDLDVTRAIELPPLRDRLTFDELVAAFGDVDRLGFALTELSELLYAA
ncbi:EcoAI/FtnUII family type I restriction enzme subunit R [Sorangium sp. KYC3313]|uniref:EcoAI/FtnUII family type I restriction enzme subunit R n=1 Tax=Sorangium sp. KYC3313 TaxID=3449740 RepID=UPI003F8C9BB0